MCSDFSVLEICTLVLVTIHCVNILVNIYSLFTIKTKPKIIVEKKKFVLSKHVNKYYAYIISYSKQTFRPRVIDILINNTLLI